MAEPRLNPLARHVWTARYQYHWDGRPVEYSLSGSWDRVATALATAERDPGAWASEFRAVLDDFCFLPGGRILAGAGTRLSGTLLNCFVMGPVEDSVAGIFDSLKEGALTLQQGGGVGYDFSTLRPRGAAARSSGATAAGPVGCMRLWDAACATVSSGSPRGGAMMATLRVDHPDIIDFIDAKRSPGRLERFNLSVGITGEFLAAVAADADWPLVFPAGVDDEAGELVSRVWAGDLVPRRCRVHGVIPAVALWKHIAAAAQAMAEPGLLFLDTINRENNLGWCERLLATNPCGEAPLPPYGACDLGSLNLAAFVRDPFGAAARIDQEALLRATAVAVRMLDNVLDLARYPLVRQREQALATRRIGLGITGLGDALAMLGLAYDSEQARRWAAATVEGIKLAAYAASVELAAEKTPFPAFERDPFLAAPFISRLPGGLRDAVARQGIRNSHLLAIAPAGSISLLAGNVSPGIEPILLRVQRRRVRGADGSEQEFEVEDRAWHEYRTRRLRTGEAAFVEAMDVAAADQLAMQAALQPHVDGAISKTVLLPAQASVADVAALFWSAQRLGLKGCTVFRPGTPRGAVVSEPGAARCAADAASWGE
jgi:ribonucleoside-diphosphate reductase alpha chain